MKIAVDAMGGDFAPEAVVQGVKLLLEQLPSHVHIILLGIEDAVKQSMKQHGLSETAVTVMHAPEVVEMGESPTKALKSKPNSSIALGVGLLAHKKVDAFCGAGNTGAMFAASVFALKPLEGLLRPAIAGLVPKVDGTWSVLVDVGANAECKPEFLEQFAVLGTEYAKHVIGIGNPRVGLINLGEEEQKGTAITKEAYQLIRNNPKVNFVGNIEGRDFFKTTTDVMIADGFVGNVIYKMGESIYEIVAAAGYKLTPFFENLNYEAIGGSPIVGINGNVIIGHGISNGLAIKNMILQAIKLVEVDFHSKMKDKFIHTPSQQV